MTPEVAFDRLLEALVEGNVDFVVVGGLALGSWGVVRGTKDVDIVAAEDEENRARLVAVAVDLGGHVQRADMLVSSAFSIGALLASEERVMIETPLGPLDVVRGLPGVPVYEELASRATEVSLLGVRVRVCSLSDLRAMKRAAGRTRDLADLEDLDAARNPEI